MKVVYRYSIIRHIILLGGMMTMIFLCSCTRSERPRVGFLIHDVEGRWINDLTNFKKLYDAMGIELIVKDADGNEALQLQQTEELIGEHVKVIVVVAVNQNTAGGIIRKAHLHNIPVVAYDRMIRNASLDYFISYEYKRMGEIMSEYALKQIPSGNYVLLWGDASDGNAQLLREGQEAVLQPEINDQKINLVYRGFVEDWSYEHARTLMNRIVDWSDEPVDMVLASNDNIARAARDVLDSMGMTSCQVVTSELAVQSSQNSQLATDQYKTDAQMAEITVEMTRDILNRQQVKSASLVVDNGRTEVPSVLVLPRY